MIYELNSPVTEKYVSSGLAGSTLKIIAMATMLIDHRGASIIEKTMEDEPVLIIIDFIIRGIGRLAFPIYIFLLIEGYKYTRSKGRYLGRLVLFSAVSEIPFDLALFVKTEDFNKGIFYSLEAQNVFFTLAFGLIAVWLVDAIRKKYEDTDKSKLLQILSIIEISVVAQLLRTDYGFFGVVAIVIAYYAKDNTVPKRTFFMLIPLIAASPLEAVALVDAKLFEWYNGKRGLPLKWVFYLFYPVHLLILAGICICLGL